MVRSPYFDKNGRKKGAWNKEEDDKLRAYIQRHGHWNWRQLPKYAGLSRCGKSCRLRWMNYLRPNVKRGNYTKEEEDLIIKMHDELGNKWSAMATKLPGRTDNEIKNHWHTYLKERNKIIPNSSEVVIMKSGEFSEHDTDQKEQSVGTSLFKGNDQERKSSPGEDVLSSSSDYAILGRGAWAEDDSSRSSTSSESFGESIGSFWTEPFLVDCGSIWEGPSSVDPGFLSLPSHVTDEEFFLSFFSSYGECLNVDF